MRLQRMSYPGILRTHTCRDNAASCMGHPLGGGSGKAEEANVTTASWQEAAEFGPNLVQI